MSQQTVGLQDLREFLEGKCGSPQMEASTIWSLLIHNTRATRDARGLPLQLSCEMCGKNHGECEHNSYYNEYFKRLEYMPKQTGRWRIQIDSLREALEALADMEIRMLGAPENPRQRRQLLVSWINSL